MFAFDCLIMTFLISKLNILPSDRMTSNKFVEMIAKALAKLIAGKHD